MVILRTNPVSHSANTDGESFRLVPSWLLPRRTQQASARKRSYATESGGWHGRAMHVKQGRAVFCGYAVERR